MERKGIIRLAGDLRVQPPGTDWAPTWDKPLTKYSYHNQVGNI